MKQGGDVGGDEDGEDDEDNNTDNDDGNEEICMASRTATMARMMTRTKKTTKKKDDNGYRTSTMRLRYGYCVQVRHNSAQDLRRLSDNACAVEGGYRATFQR